MFFLLREYVRKGFKRTKKLKSKVSILTISRGSRIPFLKLQTENVKQQTYQKIIEWVIVDGSASLEDSLQLRTFVETLKESLATPIKYVPWQSVKKIGALRNEGNRQCAGDIVVCMDDDDYYQPCYVKHAVHTLIHSPKKAQIAGCGPMFVYDMEWGMLLQSQKFHDNHSVNNCFAYTREFHQTHTYDVTVEYGEESSYLRAHEGGVPLEQMDPRKCIVHMVHKGNTYNKSRIVVSALCGVLAGAVLTTTNVYDLMAEPILKRYLAILEDPPQCPFDIVYYCGLWSEIWHPNDTTLGGSEQAVVQLSMAWAARGLRVAVYAEFPESFESMTIHGVSYFHAKHFTPRQRFDTLVCWRLYGTKPILVNPGQIDAKHILIDIHDNVNVHYRVISEYIGKYSNMRLMFKSKFHAKEFELNSGIELRSHQYEVIMNGIQTDVFANVYGVGRDPYRFCYCSCYSRGLLSILKDLWPHIHRLEPRAELHLYYGLGENEDPGFIQMYEKLILTSKGVCDHGKQPIAIVAHEKHRSNFHMYMTDTRGETDCISIRESLVAGCIPLLLDAVVFKERDGVHFDPKMTCEEMAAHIVSWMHRPSDCETVRQTLRTSSTITTWSQCADTWLEKIGLNWSLRHAEVA